AQPRFSDRVRVAAGGARVHARFVTGAAQARLAVGAAVDARGRAPRAGDDRAIGAQAAGAGARGLVRAHARSRGLLLSSVGVRRHDAGADPARLPVPHRRAGAGVPGRDDRLVQAAGRDVSADARAFVRRHVASSVNAAGRTTMAASANSLAPRTAWLVSQSS